MFTETDSSAASRLIMTEVTGMNEMYCLDLDRYGPPMEPPDDYYFAPDREPEEEELTNDE